MGEQEVIQALGIMIISAAVMVLLARLIRMPSIVVYILAGLALGPLLGILILEKPGPDTEQSTLDLVSELGIALLLFLVGLELSLERIRDVGRVAVLAGIGQVVFTAAGGFVLSILLGFAVMDSIFLAVALTFSSTVVVVKLLDQKKELHSLYGRIAVGIFLVQDLVVVVILTFLAGLGRADEAQGISQTMLDLLIAFVGMGGLLLVAVLSSRYLLVRPFRWAAPWPQMLFIWALCWCFIFVEAAEILGLSLEIGAFLAGLSLAQLSNADDLRRRVHPLMNFFIAIFFISLGARMDLSAVTDEWFSAIVLSLFVLIGNPFIFIWIISRCGYGERTSFLTSVTVAQISEFSFIFAAMGTATGLILPEIESLVMVVGVVTIGVSAYMILYNHGLYGICRRLGLLRMFRARQTEDEEPSEEISNHVVVVGMNPLGRRLASDLHRKGHLVLAIDTDARKLARLPCLTMVGNVDYLSVVEEAGLARARMGISALQIEDTNNLFAYRCKEFGVPVAIHAFDRSVVEDLKRLGADFLMDGKGLAFRLLEKELEPYIKQAAAAPNGDIGQEPDATGEQGEQGEQGEKGDDSS
ncbi:MAG: cation:proton antiporter [Phycisphaeraceae bacterium]|nr:cation:proton antiporter [Phycisphaeraceae bacterium]